MITEPTPEELNFAEQVDSILSRGNPQSGFAYRELALFLRPLRERLVLAETAVTACHAAMLGKVHPKSPAWGLVYAVQDAKR